CKLQRQAISRSKSAFYRVSWQVLASRLGNRRLYSIPLKVASPPHKVVRVPATKREKPVPPGAGKPMLAARLPSILPPLARAKRTEASRVQSASGQIEGGALTNRRPFRAQHHPASMPPLVAGGLHARPGEVPLAHHGVLFLDELPKFQPGALDSLRQPL